MLFWLGYACGVICVLISCAVICGIVWIVDRLFRTFGIERSDYYGCEMDEADTLEEFDQREDA